MNGEFNLITLTNDSRVRRFALLLWFCFLSLSLTAAGNIDLKNAVVVAPDSLSGPEKKAVAMLVEEVEKRSNVRWEKRSAWPDKASDERPVIAVGDRAQLPAFTGPYTEELQVSGEPAAEGFRICVKRAKNSGPPGVFIIGNDARGVLFGVGRLLRELHMGRGSVNVSGDLDVTTAPKYALRGHQLGYRPKCNSYDAWDLPVWEQYIRDLTIFGCNAIELIPPRSDDASDSPHFPRPPMEMMTGMSRLADDYGLSLWIWYPAMDRDYADPKTVEFALHEWGEVFGKLPRIDVVFVPGGDPGHTQPKYLMALLEKQTENLHRYHPKAQMWVSPQSFNQAWLDEFLQILDREHPAWLGGVVFGPQVRVSIARLRELVPKQYPIRHYPDITHSRQCQFPVPDWDVAYAVTEARECINPRPEGEAVIFRKTQPGTIGFLTYSEGCNDDVNKMVWSALGWDPDMSVQEILRQFSRYFIGERYTETFAQGLLDLEKDWQGSLLPNKGVDQTLAEFQRMEKSASPRDLKNWRFQQAMFRAYYDSYIRHRLIYETDLESRAKEALRASRKGGALPAIAAAEKILEQPLAEPVALDLRTRIHELAEALFQSISMQLSVAKYKAIDVDRGASLDTLEYPLNNRRWLKERFANIRQLGPEPERVAAVNEILNWTDPGPGGFYDDLGNPTKQPHLMRGPGFKGDPEAMEWPRSDFEEDLVVEKPDIVTKGARRVSWMDHAETLYDGPLRMQYKGLDAKAHYRLRVVYAGDTRRKRIRLLANEQIEVHPFLIRPFPIKPLEFDLPIEATRSGELTLTWLGEPGLGGNGRGCQVSEVWLMKDSATIRHEAGARSFQLALSRPHEGPAADDARASSPKPSPSQEEREKTAPVASWSR